MKTKTFLLLSIILIAVSTVNCQNKDNTFNVPIKANQGIIFGDGTLQVTAGTGSQTPFVYPPAGIVLSTGSLFTSITDNSAHWDLAYSWGPHAGLYRPITWVPSFSQITNKPTTLAGYGITDAALKTHNHDQSYLPITYLPAWPDITGKPVFAPVATTGDYNDLQNRPQTEELSEAISLLPALYLPVLTNAEIAALTPRKGTLVFNDTDNVLQIYNGTVWKIIITNQ